MLIARAAAAAAAAAMRLSLSRAAASTSASTSASQACRRGLRWTTTTQHSPPWPLLSITRQRLVSVASASSSPSAPSKTSELEPPDVRKLAKMAQLEVTDEEVADWEPKIRKIVSWFDQLQAIDLEAEEEKERQAEQGGAEAAAAAAGAAGGDKAFSLRSDEVSQFGGDPADALREAPEKEGEFLKVPRIM